MKKNDPRMTVPKINWSPKPTDEGSSEPPVKSEKLSQPKKESDRATPNK